MRGPRCFSLRHWSEVGHRDSNLKLNAQSIAHDFLKPVARTKILNFAAENRKGPKTGTRKVSAAEGVRDVFGRILAVVAKTSDTINLHYVLSYPITDVPLSLAHSDGTSQDRQGNSH